MQPTKTLSPSGARKRRITLIILGATMLLCLACLTAFLIDTSRPEYKATATARALATAESRPTSTQAALPADTIQPTRPQKIQPVATEKPAIAATIEVIDFTAEIDAGNTASITIRTAPRAMCTLTYTTPKGTSSSAAGLGRAVADASGICTWSWEIGASTDPGEGTLRITANGVTESRVIIIK